MSFPARFKLAFVSILFAICYLLFAVVPVSAQSNYSPNLNPDVPMDQHSLVQSTLIETMSAVICQLSGVDPIRNNQKCLGVDSKTGKIGFVENGGGALGVMGTLMSYTFIRPASSEAYINYLSNNFGFPKKTYANTHDTTTCGGNSRGVGFCGIEPLIGIWVAMRNIAYLLFVIIFVLIGLAIMLRVHIDPRTIMTIENQIPKIIIGIILVTFSFAIAGLLIDVMYVAIYLVGGVLISIPGFPDTVQFSQIATSPTPIDALNRLWPGTDDPTRSGGGFFEISNQGSRAFTELVQLAFENGNTDHLKIPSAFDAISNVSNFLIGAVVYIAAFFFIILGLVFATVRLWLIMVMSYINILLDIVFAPFWFLIGLLPGSSVGVGAWFKDMLANLAVFPTALAMLVLGRVFGEIARSGGTNTLFTPPLTGASGNAGSDAFAGLIMLGFIFMTPHVLQITRNAIKAPNINYGPVLQPAAAGAGMVIGSAREFGSAKLAGQEYIMGKGQQWKPRGTGRAILGGLVGRR